MEKLFDQLTQTQISLQHFFDLSPDLLCVLDLEGNFIYFNRVWESKLGWTETDLYSRAWSDFVDSEDIAQSRDRFTSLTQNLHFPSSVIVENRFCQKDGGNCWLWWEFSQASDRRIYGIARDITERKQAEAALYQQIQREQSLNRVVQTIRNSLDLNTIFSTAVREIGYLLKVDRVVIAQYLSQQQSWSTVADFRRIPGLPSLLSLEFPDTSYPFSQHLKRQEIIRINSVDQSPNPAYSEFTHLYPGAWLSVPLQVGNQLWGSLSLNQIQQPWSWQNHEIDLSLSVATQLAIAIQQSQLYTQIQRFSTHLEEQVRTRTSELQLARDVESTLKRINERVRDSLDEAQIVQTAVQELGKTLGVNSCNAALYDLSLKTTTICYEYNPPLIPFKGRVASLEDYPEIYEQLLKGECFQFCNCHPNPIRGWTAILVCPIVEEQKILGDLWLINDSDYIYRDWEIRLVQQVANQCAIALRQSRLYQNAQKQVRELEQLNLLKDQFLSTVSHELRTPMTNIKMTAQLLEITLDRKGYLSEGNSSLSHYLKILKSECEKEIELITNLLDLSRLESKNVALDLIQVDLRTCLAEIIKPFLERARQQQQLLQIQVAPDITYLQTDRLLLSRIISELLHNACKYTPAGEKIIISVIAVSDYVEISITNTGIEIPSSEHERIFDKFYRIPNNDPWKHGGTGLGLALVKEQVQQLQGIITASSQNQTTSFTIQLPKTLT